VARRILGIAAILAAFLVVGVAAAGASTPPPQVTDPSATSPAGTIYAIPVESARQDAEPHRRPAASGTGTASSTAPVAQGSADTTTQSAGTAASAGSSGSAAGSSTTRTTTGASAAHGHGKHGAAAVSSSSSGGGSSGPSSGSQVLVPGGQPGSLVASSNGFGSSPQVPGLNAASSTSLGAIQQGGSDAPLLAIVLAIVVLGAGAYLGTRGRRRPTDSSSA
jgi:hypothetical protein